jgi:hypothetical protein
MNRVRNKMIRIIDRDRIDQMRKMGLNEKEIEVEIINRMTERQNDTNMK